MTSPPTLFVVGFFVGQQARLGRDDRDAQPAQDLGQLVRLRVHAKPGFEILRTPASERSRLRPYFSVTVSVLPTSSSVGLVDGVLRC